MEKKRGPEKIKCFCCKNHFSMTDLPALSDRSCAFYVEYWDMIMLYKKYARNSANYRKVYMPVAEWRLSVSGMFPIMLLSLAEKYSKLFEEKKLFDSVRPGLEEAMEIGSYNPICEPVSPVGTEPQEETAEMADVKPDKLMVICAASDVEVTYPVKVDQYNETAALLAESRSFLPVFNPSFSH